MKKLSELQPGESGTVAGFLDSAEHHERLQELGLVSGTQVRVIRFAPFGDPMEIELRGYRLSVRKEDAELVKIKVESL